jgi:hypothetical protein
MDLQTPTVKEEIRRYSSQYSARLSAYPNVLLVNLVVVVFVVRGGVVHENIPSDAAYYVEGLLFLNLTDLLACQNCT